MIYFKNCFLRVSYEHTPSHLVKDDQFHLSIITR